MDPSRADYIEASRTADDVVEQGAFHWRNGGSVPGERQQYVDAALRESLIEALAQLDAIEGSGEYENLKDEIGEAQRKVADLASDHEIGSDFAVAIGRVADGASQKFPECVSELVDGLAKCIADQRVVIADLRSEIAGLTSETNHTTDEPFKIRLVRPGAAKARPKRGSTTLTLPFLTPAANEVVEIREVMPSKIGSVKVEKEKKAKTTGTKRGRKAAAK